MPTVSTVENTTSARFNRPSDESTVTKSPPYPPAPSRPRFSAAPVVRAQARGLRSPEVVPHFIPALGELVLPKSE